jgi:large subunit ribosomal protein L6
MSKIGKKLITIPEGVTVSLVGDVLKAKGPKGELSLVVHPDATVEITEKTLVVKKTKEDGNANAIWGLTRSLANNIIIGVSAGYEKKLEVQGVGFRMSIQGKKIVMALGFSHPVEVEIPDGIVAKLEDNGGLLISGIDKQAVGQFAANIKDLKKVEPYKGKGFRYAGEKVRRKAGKKAGTK